MPEVLTFAHLRALTVQPDRLLMTKLYAPPARTDRVPRPRLTARLHEGLRCKMLLVSAPAGSGKTTALSEWVEVENGAQAAIAWVSLDKGDNDPVRFITYFIAALQTVQAGLGSVALALLESSQSPALDTVLTTLINELIGAPHDLAIVLDDAHVLTAPEAQRVLEFLLDHLPPQVHLIIASRTEPPLALARLRARNQVVELHAPDLRFTLEETTAFFKQIMGLNLAPEDVELLSASTEGWAAGLQLAALSLRGERDVSQRIKTFAGNDRYILDFLLAEVLQQQSREVQAFLLETAILDRFNAPLCAALTGRTDAQTLLEQLEQSNLFIVPLDNVRSWYRYHHLFADLLRDRLRQAQPDRIRELHRRASDWYVANQLTREAIQHALAARDFERALDLIEPIARTLITHNENATLHTWLSAVPDDMLHDRPSLALKYVWALGSLGQPDDANRWLEQIEQTTRDLPTAVRGEAKAARANLAVHQGQFSHAIELLNEAEALIPAEAIMLRGVIAVNRGIACMMSGHNAAAETAYIEAAALSEVAGNPHSVFTALNNLGILQVQQGQLRQAADTYRRALGLADAMLDSTELQQAIPNMVHISLAETLYEWNELEAALAEAQRGMSADPQHVLDEAAQLAGYMITASIQRATGDFDQAASTLAEGERLGAQRHKRSYLHESLRALQARFALWRGDVSEAQRWATEQPLPLDAAPDRLRSDYHRYFTLARVLIPRQPAQAIELLDRMVIAFRAQQQLGGIIEAQLLLALAHQRMGHGESARQALHETLSLAAPQGHVRVFVDEGEPMRLLIADFRRWFEKQSRRECLPLLDYCARLLAAFQSAPRSAAGASYGQPSKIPHLVEPLSEREREILQLIGHGLSNQEIAQRMILAVSTVKWHLNNIYAKLDAHSRTQALARAKELGLF